MKISIITVTLVSTIFIEPGLTMVNMVIRRGDPVRLTCDHFDSSINQSVDPFYFPVLEESTSKLTWFLKPFNGSRGFLSNAKVIKSEYREVFRISSPSDDIIESLDASLVPGGTYECYKVEPEVRIKSELIVLETEPTCHLVLTGSEVTDAGHFSNDSDGFNGEVTNSIRRIEVSDGASMSIACAVSFSGHLKPSLRLSLDSRIAATRHPERTDESGRCNATVSTKVSFEGSDPVRVGLNLAFQPDGGDTLKNTAVYEIDFHLLLFQKSRKVGQTSSEMTPIVKEVFNDDRTKQGPNSDISTMIIIGVLIALVLFLAVAFSSCYILITKKIKDIQAQSTNVSGGSMPFVPREEKAASLYDEINPDEEVPGFFAASKPYEDLDQSTMSKNKPTRIVSNSYSKLNVATSAFRGEQPKPPGLDSTTTTTTPTITTTEAQSSEYLDLVSSYVIMENIAAPRPTSGHPSSEYVTHDDHGNRCAKMLGAKFSGSTRVKLTSFSSSTPSSSPTLSAAARIGSKQSSNFESNYLDGSPDPRLKSRSFVYQNDA